MDNVVYVKDRNKIQITDFYDDEPLITIYENALEEFTFEIRDGEYSAALSKEKIKSLIKLLQEIT